MASSLALLATTRNLAMVRTSADTRGNAIAFEFEGHQTSFADLE
jgi:hypothetical protein